MKYIVEILNEIKNNQTADSSLLKRLIAAIRPEDVDDIENIERCIFEIILLLRRDSELRDGLQNYLYHLFYDKKLVKLFTESGILSNAGFFKETSRKISEFLLPPLYDDNDITKIIVNVFNRQSDYKWVSRISNKIWLELFEILSISKLEKLKNNTFQKQVKNSILILSHRIANLGIEPHVIDKLPQLDESLSPFLLQNKEIVDFLDNDSYNDKTKLEKISQLLHSCKSNLESIRANKDKFGASLSLTYTLQRLSQNLERIYYLVQLISLDDRKGKNIIVGLFKELIKAENKKHSLNEYFSENLELIAFQVTEHAGKTGEHYITQSRKQYKNMFISALGGGFIVSFLTIIKTAIYYLNLPLFGQAFMYSMNYSFGFMSIHLTRSTLATKQPAMTASRIAKSLDINNSIDKSISFLANLIIKICRSQFIALIGNVIIAFPIAYALSWGYYYFSGHHLADPEKALKMINEIDPFQSLSLFHAAIAGVYLFIAGLISGFYDNRNVYYKISQRIAKHPLLLKIVGPKVLTSISNYLDKNLGSLAGNFFFGIFLGSTGVIGVILGLPIDIRHITFASGNFGIALAALENQVALKTIVISIFGIFGIGLVNLFVSFGLALFVAIKSRRVNFKQGKKLIEILFSKFMNRPRDFFFPPKEIVLLPEDTQKLKSIEIIRKEIMEDIHE